MAALSRFRLESPTAAGAMPFVSAEMTREHRLDYLT